MPSKSRKAAIRQSNTRKRKKVTKPNIKNFDLEKPQDINEITEINKDNSDYNNIAQHYIQVRLNFMPILHSI